MGNKVLLLEPPVIIRHEEFHQCLPPLGLLYIASYLRENGHEVKILDACVEGWMNRIPFEKGWDYKGLTKEEVKQAVLEFAPDIVGISWKFSRQERAFNIALSSVKESVKNATVVIGGAHPSSNPVDVLKRYDIDYIVLGEGEVTFKKLIDSLNEKESKAKLDGIAFRENGKFVINEKISYIRELDLLPFPARDILPTEKYLNDNLANEFKGDVREYPKSTIITSRGCPERCTFCAIKGIWGRTYRTRSPENVIDEIDEMINKYGIKEVHFLDDNLTLDKKRASGIFDLIIKRGLNFHWRTPNGVSSKTLDPELISKMKQSGCYRLSLGIESGNVKILNKVIKKNLDLENVKQVNRWIKNAGLECEGFFILGMPGENADTIKDTIRLALEMDLDSAAFFSAQPYPGTELFKLCTEKGYIDIRSSEYLATFNPSVDTPFLSKGELKQFQRIANYSILMKNKKPHWKLRLKYLISILLLKFYTIKRRLKVEPTSYLRPFLP